MNHLPDNSEGCAWIVDDEGDNHLFDFDILDEFFVVKGNPSIPVELNWILTTEDIPPPKVKILAYNGFVIRDTSWELHTNHDEEWFRKSFTHWCARPNTPPKSEV